MPRLTSRNLKHVNKGAYLKPNHIERKAFFVEGLSTQADRNPIELQNLWNVFKDFQRTIKNRVQPKKFYGISFSPSEEQNQAVFYMAAVEVDSIDSMQPGSVVKQIPTMTCASFIHKGPFKDLSLTLDYIYHTWLPKSGCRLTFPFEIESFGPELADIHTEDTEIEINIPIAQQS